MNQWLTGSQKVLLRRLAKTGGVVSKEQLIQTLWGHDPNGGPGNAPGTISTMISHMRKMLSHYGIFVVTVRGVGYCLRLDPGADVEQTIVALEAHELATAECRARKREDRRTRAEPGIPGDSMRPPWA